jgi:acid phosphatase (class A)
MDYNHSQTQWYVEKMQEYVGEKVDSLTYMGIENKKPKNYPISDLIDINWKEVLADPPTNTSATTKHELEYLQEVTKNPNEALVKMVDKQFGDPLFKNVLGNRPFPQKEVDKLWNIVDNVIQMLKYKHDRPRPYQLAPLMGYDVKVLHSDSHLTPAYPSGHTAYGAIVTYYLAALYPYLSRELFRIPGQIGLARCMQGVHYPSDSEASMVIVGAIWENIRYKLYPNLIGV